MVKKKTISNIIFWIAMVLIIVPHVGSLLKIELFSNLNLISHSISMLIAVAMAIFAYMGRKK